jgi:hypothetical protein
MLEQQSSAKQGVFISHRGEDIDLAERLAIQLRQAGFEVWLDKWNIGIGDSIIGKINAGLETPRYLILCYSEAGVTSPWMSREWMATLAQQLNGYEVKVLPVRLSGGKPPAIMADIKYADLVKDWEHGMQGLLKAMRR